MASAKQYGFYIEGNKIALVQKDTSFDNDANSRDYGPDADRSRWKSPIESADSGLEIQYSYSPEYAILAGGDINDVTRAGSGSLGAEYPFFGYTSKGGYLAFVHCNQGAAFVDWSGSGYNEEFIVDDYILIQNSVRWNGLHKVKSREADGGMIVTHTPFAAKFSYEGDLTFATDETITGDSASDDKPAIDNIFGTDSSVTQYLVTVASAQANNKVIFKVTRTDSGELTVSNNIAWHQGEWNEVTGSVTAASSDACTIYKVIKDNLIIYPNNAISVLQDESFEIDLPIYLQKALVHFVKSRMLEDLGELKLSEYFYNKFVKQLEKHNNARVPGLRMLSSGPNAIR